MLKSTYDPSRTFVIQAVGFHSILTLQSRRRRLDQPLAFGLQEPSRDRGHHQPAFAVRKPDQRRGGAHAEVRPRARRRWRHRSHS